MRIIDRYIILSVIANIMVVLFILGGMDTLFAFIAELEDLTPQYILKDAAIFALATFPRRCYEFIPVASLMGSMLALGAMANNSELVVLRAAGVSIGKITQIALYPVLGFALIAMLLGQYVIPPAEQFARNHQALAQGGGTLLKTKQGNWHREGNDFIFISALEPTGVLHGVMQFSFDEAAGLKSISFAQRAHLQEGAWQLRDFSQTKLGENSVSASFSENSAWDTDLSFEKVKLVITKPDFLSLTRLYEYAQYQKQQGLDNSRFVLSFWKKLLQPLATVVMLVLAVSFIFGPLRSVTVGSRIMIGLVCGMLFHYLQDFMVNAALVFNFSSVIAIMLPMLLFGCLGVCLLYRVR